MKHLKLFFALFAMLALGVGNAWAEEVTETIKMKGFGGKTNSVYQNVTVSGTSDAGTAMVAYAYNGGNGQVRGNKTAVAGASVPSEDKNKNWSLYNSEAMGGSIKSITVTQTATGNNKFQNNLYVSLGTSSQGSVTAIKNAQKQDAGGTAKEINFTIDASKGYTYFKLLSTEKFVTGSIAGVVVTVTYETSSGGDEPETPATTYTVTVDGGIQNGTVTASPTEAAEGAIVTLTATPTTGYKFDAWDVKDASSKAVSVDANGKFTMPASNVTVSASFVAKTQYTIKWNVVEGSVADTYVYEGDALGTLPTADNCSSGKVFVGWTEATSVNADGSSITYAKATDVPAGNKEYNAVYATLSGSADKVDNLDLSLTDASGSTYSSWSGKKSVSDAVYAGNSAGGNSSIQLRHDTEKAASGVITTTSGGKATKVAVTWHSSTTNGRTLNVYGNNTPYSTVKDLWDGEANQGTLLGTIVYGTSTELQIEGDYKYIGLRSKSGAMYLSQIDITWSATSASDYSLNCEVNNTPFLTVAETPINFGTVAQNETVTKTFTVTGGYLAEDVALTISGTNASFFSVSPVTITKADDVEEIVTVTYNPTATGDHTATLTIKTGDITKEIALSGKVLAPGKWVLVKDVATLSAGDEIIIAAADADYAIGAAASNNYKGAAITKVGETANADASVTVLTVEETGVAEAPFAFKTDSKYLYAASSSSNHLKAQATNNENGQWAITITAEGVASIEAAKSSNRKVMQYNPNSGSPIFACYETASQKPLAIYRNSENVAKPVISGDADFVGSTQVTITAQSGLTVYYTTDGTDPNNTSAQYTAPFTINATTTVKAIAYDASSNASSVAEMTFTKHELVNVATAMKLAKDEIAYFAEFEVVKVVTGKGNIYIKDASGHGLIYDNTLAGELKDGDRVQGFVGISSPYNDLPEAKPYNVTYADLTITSGVAAEPYDFTSTAIAATDINKYVVFNDVEIATAVSMSNSNKEFSLTINGSNVAFYNQFSIEKTLEAGKTYDIYGFVAIYNGNLQVYFYQALEEGEVVTKYTVTYNAGGATGEVPVDNNEYTEGAQVYLKSATGLTKEGYDYKGWKVTDEDGNEITVSSNKFNMPASNVTVTAQWEEIVVTPRQDFSAGLWVLVTDASELAANDYIIVAAKDYNVAMVSYDYDVRKNNCGQTNITKFGNNNCFLTWKEEIGVFQLANSGSNFTIQDVNTEEYLYAAGGESSNYLKAADEIPADAEDAKPYIWSITIADGVTTVQATSNGRNLLKYNATNNSGQLFSCYASGQKDIAIYKYVTDFYTRNVTVNNFGTICLPYGSSNYSGAEFYEFVGKETGKVWLASVDKLEAGVPYVFMVKGTQLVVAYEGTPVEEPGKNNGLYGTFTDNTPVEEGYYIISQGKVLAPCGTGCYVNANRAYVVMGDIQGDKPSQQMPGRKYIGMDVLGENEATGVEDLFTTDAPVKVIENGQLIIIRDGVKYNVQGQKL